MDGKSKLITNLTIVILVWIFVYWTILVDMVSVWQGSETYKHCFFILPICLYLLYEQKNLFKTINYKVSYIALLPLLLTQLVYLISELTYINILGHASAYISLVCILWFILGNQFVKVALFPLFYLSFAVPVGEELVPVLQQVTADLAIVFINWFNVPVYRDGLYLHTPNGLFFVAEACAGIRFLIAMVAIGVLYAYMFFNSWRKRAVFIALSFIVPILANGFRAAGIVIIGHYSDMEHAVGADHLIYGWFFFAFVLGLLIFIGSFWQDQPTKITNPPVTYQLKVVSKFSSMSLLLIGLVLPYVYIANITSYSNNGDITHTQVLDINYENYESIEKAHWGVDFPSADIKTTLRSLDNSHSIFTATYFNETDNKELINWNNKQFGADSYSIKSQQTLELEHAKMQVVQLASSNSQDKTLVYFYMVDNNISQNKISVKLAQLKSKLFGNNGKGSIAQVFFEQPRNIEEIKQFIPSLGLINE